MKVVIIDDEPLISDKLKRIMETGLRGMHTVCASAPFLNCSQLNSSLTVFSYTTHFSAFLIFLAYFLLLVKNVMVRPYEVRPYKV